MILVDTSIWVDHLRRGESALAAALNAGEVCVHPLVHGELACGNLKNRREVLDLLARLPRAPTATDAEALEFLERRALMGRGIGIVDVHLLASAALGGTIRLWTRDRRLRVVAGGLGLSHAPA
ncbi:MAG TPA: PIN domain-containing protein [Gemmatimonadales bacterium]|nr:PIN domain-containing protein [Gemmatimonadales bacterium]